MGTIGFGLEIEFATVKSLENVTIGYCDTFATPLQSHNIREALHFLRDHLNLYKYPPLIWKLCLK